MFENLKQLYHLKKSVRRSKRKWRFYHRQVEQERLRLVESGACPECVDNYCNYLVYGNEKLCITCESGQKFLDLSVCQLNGHANDVRIHARFNECV